MHKRKTISFFAFRDDVKRNIELYDEWAIEFYPIPFLYERSVGRWNTYIVNLCNRLPEGTVKLSAFQLKKMRLYKIFIILTDFE